MAWVLFNFILGHCGVVYDATHLMKVTTVILFLSSTFDIALGSTNLEVVGIGIVRRSQNLKKISDLFLKLLGNVETK